MNYKLILVKKNKIWIWTTVNKHFPGLINWGIGDRYSKTFKQLWKTIKGWKSFWYVTDGWKGETALIIKLSVSSKNLGERRRPIK